MHSYSLTPRPRPAGDECLAPTPHTEHTDTFDTDTASNTFTKIQK